LFKKTNHGWGENKEMNNKVLVLFKVFNQHSRTHFRHHLGAGNQEAESFS